jgi:hypothetical protein
MWSRCGLGLAVAGVVLFAGCTRDAGGESGSEGILNRAPAAYHPEQFPDIPFERLVGYRLTAEDSQVAVAYAGGALRRLNLVFITKPGDDARPPQEERDRIIGGLNEHGWRLSASEGDEIRFTKGDELLVVSASTEGSATIIAVRLEPKT